MLAIHQCHPGDELYHQYVPELGEKVLPHFVTTILVIDQSNCVGRLSLFYNPQIQYRNQPVVLGGYFYCKDDAAVAQALLTEAEKIARNAGFIYLIAPVNGNTWNDYRLPLTGEGALFTGDNTQPLYLSSLLRSNGFEVIEQYYSSRSSLSLVQENAKELLKLLEQDGIFIRSMREAHFLEELELLYPICNAAFVANPLFSKTSWEDFKRRYLPLQPLLDYSNTLLAFDKELTLLAFMICYRDHQNKTDQTLVLKTIAKNPQKNIPGLMSRMGNLLYAQAKLQGYTAVIHAMMHEANPSIKRSKAFGGEVLRTYGLFGKQL